MSAGPQLKLDLDRCDRIYRDGDQCKGVLTIEAGNKGFSHNGIVLSVWGLVKLTLNPSSVGLLETFYSSIKPHEILKQEIRLTKAGSIPEGKTDIPFQFLVTPAGKEALHPTFHGVYVTVAYGMRVDFETRGWSGTKLSKEIEFIMDTVHVDGQKQGGPVDFQITPASLENVHKTVLKSLPSFSFVGRVTNSRCLINSPFTGEIEIKEAKAPIRSISLQLVRVETVIFSEGAAKEATEIQNIQIANGDVCRKMVIPIYMIFPRLFTCPTLMTDSFKVEFEINLIVLFEDSHMITENFPIELIK